MLRKLLSTFLLLLLLVVLSCRNEPTKKTASLPIKAAVIFNFGGPQAVAQTKFYLLNRDLDDLVDESKRLGVLIQPSDFWMWLDDVPKPPPGIVEEGIKQYLVSTVTTDFEGSGKFENVPLGKYYLVGFTTTRKEDEFVLWNLPVVVDSENQTLMLSQRNGFAGTIYQTKSVRNKQGKP